MWSFGGNKQTKQWLWFALDEHTRDMVGVSVGDRSRTSAQALWQSLPPGYRQCAVCSTACWQAYEHVIPSQRHRAVGKETGQTSDIERFNNTVRQRVGRLVRQTLSFAQKLSNHIGAVWNFVHHDKAS